MSPFEATMRLEASAFVSLLILGCNLIMKLHIYILRKRFKEEDPR
jgi:hypothetical protein